MILTVYGIAGGVSVSSLASDSDSDRGAAVSAEDSAGIAAGGSDGYFCEGKVVVLTQSSNTMPFYKYNTTDMTFETSSSGAIKKYVEFKDTEPSVSSQAIIVVMNKKVVGVYLINE